jgi:tellurite resistance protein TerC
VVLLAGGIVYSLWRTRGAVEAPAEIPPQAQVPPRADLPRERLGSSHG